MLERSDFLTCFFLWSVDDQIEKILRERERGEVRKLEEREKGKRRIKRLYREWEYVCMHVYVSYVYMYECKCKWKEEEEGRKLKFLILKDESDCWVQWWMFPTEEGRWLVILYDFFASAIFFLKREIYMKKKKGFENWKWKEKGYGEEMFLKKTRHIGQRFFHEINLILWVYCFLYLRNKLKMGEEMFLKKTRK